jgi:hypothetical protein
MRVCVLRTAHCNFIVFMYSIFFWNLILHAEALDETHIAATRQLPEKVQPLTVTLTFELDTLVSCESRDKVYKLE